MKLSRTSSIPSNIPPCVTCGDEISAMELKDNHGECFVCHLDRQRLKVEANLAYVRQQKAVTPSAHKLVPISLRDPTETLRPVAEILLDASESWELNQKRLLFALLSANPMMSAPLMHRLERATLAVNGKPIQSSKDLLKHYGHEVTVVTVCEAKPDDSEGGSAISDDSVWIWNCGKCGGANTVPSFASFRDFQYSCATGSSLKPAVITPHVTCRHCSSIRNWTCVYPSCGAESPYVIQKPGRRLVPWMCCLSCGRFKSNRWHCSNCAAYNGPEKTGKTSDVCGKCGKSATMSELFDTLRSTHTGAEVEVSRNPMPTPLPHSISIESVSPYHKAPVPGISASQSSPRGDDTNGKPSSLDATSTSSPTSAFRSPRKSTVSTVDDDAKSTRSSKSRGSKQHPKTSAVLCDVPCVEVRLDELFKGDVLESLQNSSYLGPLIRLTDIVHDKPMRFDLRRKLSQLTQTYTHVRVLKADGNDFYRAVAFAMIESAVKSKRARHIRDVIERFVPLVKSVTNGLAAVLSLQDWEALLCGVKCKQDADSVRELIESTFADSKVFDEGIVRLLRLLVNQFVSKHPHTNVHGTTYETLTAGKPLDHYCRDTILKMGAQPSNISTHATARTLGVTIRCVLFDRPQDVDLGFVDYPDSDVTSHGVPEIHLLVVSDQVCLLYSHDTASIFSPKAQRPNLNPIATPSMLHASPHRQESFDSTIALSQAKLLHEVRDVSGSAEITTVMELQKTTPAGSSVTESESDSNEEVSTEGDESDDDEWSTEDAEASTPSEVPIPNLTDVHDARGPSTATVNSSCSGVSVVCGQRLFVSHCDSDMRLTVSSGPQPKLLLSDDFNPALDSWTIQLALSGDMGESYVFLVHNRTRKALSYSAHLLECKHDPSPKLKDGVWRMSSITTDPGTIRLRHVVTGLYLTAVSERITMLSPDEMKRQKSVTHWSITSAD